MVRRSLRGVFLGDVDENEVSGRDGIASEGRNRAGSTYDGRNLAEGLSLYLDANQSSTLSATLRSLPIRMHGSHSISMSGNVAGSNPTPDT